MAHSILPFSLVTAFNRQPRTAVVLLALASTATLAACNKAPAAEAGPVVEAVSVQTTEVGMVKSPVLLRLTGSLKGAKEADLAANVAGRVIHTDVERGQRIEKGDILAKVDVAAAQLALAEARVGVESSKTQEEINKTDCERYEKLKASGAVSALEYDQVTAKCRTAPLDVEAAQARQRMAAKNVGDGIIRSPFSGVVTDRYIEQGEYVMPSSKVVSLAEVDHLRLLFSVPEKNYPDVKVDAVVALQVAAYKDIRFPGTVSHISGAVRATRDVLVEAAVENPESKLLPGMFAELELNIGEQDLPAVPKSAVFTETAKLNVFIVRDGLLIQKIVQAAPAVGDQIPILHGVLAGERVVTTYDSKLKNGQKVK